MLQSESKNRETWLIVAVIILAAGSRLYFVINFNINWDEFFFLSFVHSYLRGVLTSPLQTFHVHFFPWLAKVSINEVDQVVAARLIMLLLQSLSALFLYRICRRLFDCQAALFAVAAFLSFSFVVRNGASFRTDPIALCLLMAALDLVAGRGHGLWRYLLSGFLLAVASMVTIKSALFAPVFAALFAIDLGKNPRAKPLWLSWTALGVVFAVSFFALLQLHAVSLQVEQLAGAQKSAGGSFTKTVSNAGFLPQPKVLLQSLRYDSLLWLLWLGGIGFGVWRAIRPGAHDRRKWLTLLALALPVTTLFYYRNSFSYFYPFILAPASAVFCASWVGLGAAAARWEKPFLMSLAGLVTSAFFALNLLTHGVFLPQKWPLAHQRDVLSAVHGIFPEPVPYLDRGSMVASFPKIGFFMSTWGMENYRARGRTVFPQLIAEHQPPLMLANHPLLDPEGINFPKAGQLLLELFPKDATALESSYIHHWGPIYVAGKRFDLAQTASPRTFEILLGGAYRLESERPVLIDGRTYEPGESVFLPVGPHVVSADPGAGEVALRWAAAGPAPERPAPAGPLFFGY